jgi:signal peptidase I
MAVPEKETSTAPDLGADGVTPETEPTKAIPVTDAPASSEAPAPEGAPTQVVATDNTKTDDAPTQVVATETPAPGEEAPAKKKRSLAGKIGEIPLLVFLAFLIAVIIKTFLVQAFFIPSGSMIPTLRVGDRVLVEKVGYLFGAPGRGDVVVFEKSVFGEKKTPDLPWYNDVRVFLKEMLGLPTGLEEDYIKRVVAVGGDTIAYRGSPRRLFVNGQPVDQSFVKGGRDPGSPTITADDCRRLEMQRAGNACRVPAGKIFVMGDNRSNSEDSRVLGPIDEEKIVGRAFVVIWPPGDFGGL